MIILCLLLMCSQVLCAADCSVETKQELKTFDYFFNLPLDVQKLIMSYVWEESPSWKFLEDVAGKYKHIVTSTPRNKTTEIPITFLTYRNNIAEVIRVGTIEICSELQFGHDPLLNEYRDVLFDYTSLFLNDPLLHKAIKIKINTDATILSATFSVHGDFAILWRQENSPNTPSYVSYFSLEEITKYNRYSISLENKKLKIFTGNRPRNQILYDISGIKTIIFGYLDEDLKNLAKATVIPEGTTKQLTFVQQCKRLGINTPEVKALLKNNREKRVGKTNPVTI